MEQPAVSDELLLWLDKHFPDKCPSTTDTDREIWAAVGARRVVEHLKALNRRNQGK